MLDFSPIQILIVLVIALLVFGPKRLPEMGKSIGRGIREFKGAITDEEPSRPPAAAGPPAPQHTATAVVDAPPAPGPVAATPAEDDSVLEGVVLSGDTPPRDPQA